MSKTVKEMISRDYASMIEGVDDALLVSIRGIDANSTNTIRRKLQAKDIRITIVRNALAKRVFEGSGLEPLTQVLSGASALAYGAETVVDVAREIVGLLKDYPDIELKGAVLDGQLFEGEAGVTQLSKFPTRVEAIADVVTLVLSPGRNLSAAIKGPGAQLAGVIKAIQKKLEDGEEIKKVG
jgi:large subunit ribosomal protein L10